MRGQDHAEVAQVYGISEAHLMKITHQLGRRARIETVRSKGGGMRLAHAPEESISARWCAAWNPTSIWSSASPRAAPAGSRGAAGWPVLDGALLRFLEHLDGFTLADALETTGRRKRDARSMLYAIDSGARWDIASFATAG